jgi:hypothetical protein
MGCRPACVGELRESMFWHSDEWVRGVDALGLWGFGSHGDKLCIA